MGSSRHALKSELDMEDPQALNRAPCTHAFMEEAPGMGGFRHGKGLKAWKRAPCIEEADKTLKLPQE